VVELSDSVRAGAPIGEQVSEVSAINDAVTVDVRLRESRVDWSPEREQRAEISTIDLVVDEQVRETLASVGDSVGVEVGRTSGDFARIAYAVVVAVGLQRIRDRGAVVGGVGSAVVVGVYERWSCN
jgi:hypothetical protein